MDPATSVNLRQQMQPVHVKQDDAAMAHTNSSGAGAPSTEGGLLSETPNGHPVGVSSATAENPTSQDNRPPTNDNIAAQTAPIEETSSLQQTFVPSNMADPSTSRVLTPFLQPHLSTQLPAPPPLTADQKAKYSKLLTAAQSWTSVPSTAKSREGTPLTPSEKLWLTRECLLRYLRASKWAVPTATTRLLATLTWRREYGVEKLTDDYISEENETGKQVILGYDNQGRPCLYLNPHKQNTKGKEKQIQHLVFMLERCIDLMAPGVETLALLVNFKESRKGQNATVGQGRETLSILQNHYPERLGRALCQDVPWLIWGFFKAISPFIDPLTREKLKFDEDLRQLVPPEQLIEAYGGDVNFEYVHEKYWPALNDLAGQRRKERLERWEKAGSLIGESESYLKGLGESVSAADGAEIDLEKAMADSSIGS